MVKSIDKSAQGRDEIAMNTVSHPIDFMRSRYTPLRNAPKILARLSGMSHRTCGKWLRAEGDPSAEALLTLARNCPETKAALIAWLNQETP